MNLAAYQERKDKGRQVGGRQEKERKQSSDFRKVACCPSGVTGILGKANSHFGPRLLIEAARFWSCF